MAREIVAKDLDAKTICQLYDNFVRENSKTAKFILWDNIAKRYPETENGDWSLVFSGNKVIIREAR